MSARTHFVPADVIRLVEYIPGFVSVVGAQHYRSYK